MAKKRLNKKLVMILVLILLPVIGLGINLVMRYSIRDAMPFYEDALELIHQADSAAEANATEAEKEADPQISYELLTSLNAETVDKLRNEALNNLQLAIKYSTNDSDLQRLSANKKAEVYLQQDNWLNARDIWRKLFDRDPLDAGSKRKLVEFYYEAAKVSSQYTRGDISLWKEVLRQGKELISIESEDVYGYLVGSHAIIELVRIGAEEDAENWIGQAQELLSKVKELNPTHIDLHHHSGRLALLKSKLSEIEADKDLYSQEAGSHFQQAISDQPDDPQGYITLCEKWILPAVYEKFMKSQSEPSGEKRDQLQEEAETVLEEALQQIDGMIERFSDRGEFYILKVTLLEMRYRRLSDVDYVAIIELYRKALEQDPDRMVWTYALANTYQTRSLLSETVQSDLENAYGLLRRGLYLPRALAFKGPRGLEVRQFRLRMLQLLVKVCTSLALDEDETNNARYLEVAKGCLSETLELVSSESPHSLKALGSVALIQGDREEALKNFYFADEEFKALGIEDSQLKLKLFHILRDSQYISLAVEYGVEAIKVGMQFPRQFIEVMDTLHTLTDRYSIEGMLEIVDTYDFLFGLEDSHRSKILRYKVEALFRSGKKEQALEIMAGLDGDSYELSLLRAKMEEDQDKRIDALEQLAAQKPGDDFVMSVLYSHYLEAGKEDERYIERGRALVKTALEDRPDHVGFKQMQEVFAHSNPFDLNQDQLKAILLKVAKGISDPFTRESQLGKFYQGQAQSDMQAENPEQARKNWENSLSHYLSAASLKEDDYSVQVEAFRAILNLKDWTQAQDLIGKVNKQDAIIAMGLEADLELAQERWSEAANTLEQLLKERPISLVVHLNLSRAYAQLDRRDDALREALRAFDLDRTSGVANRVVVILKHQVNQQKGLDQLSVSEVAKIRGRLEIVLQSGKRDDISLRLRVIYDLLMMEHLFTQRNTFQGIDVDQKNLISENIGKLYRRSAAVCEHLISKTPDDVGQRKMLANIHHRYSQMVDDETKRLSLLELVNKVYQEGIQANPTSAPMAAAYSNYLLNVGRGEEAEKMLITLVSQSQGNERQEARLRLSSHYLRLTNYASAEFVLKDILKEESRHREASSMLARTYVRQSKSNEAKTLYQRLRKEQDSEKLAIQHARLLINLGQIKDSQVVLNQARKDYSDSIELMLVEINQSIAKLDYEEAVDFADKVIERFPSQTSAYFLKAQALAYNQLFPQSIECLQRLRGMVEPEDPLGRDLLWQVYWYSGRYNEAISEMKVMLRANPNQPQIRQMLMKRLSDRERWNELEQLYEESIRLYPGLIEMYLEAANSQIRHGDILKRKAKQQGASQKYARAKLMLERALILSQKKGRLKDRVRNGFIRYMLTTNQNQEVLDLVDPVISIYKNPYSLLLYKAEALHQMGRDDEAMSVYEQAMVVSSENVRTSGVVLEAVYRAATREFAIDWAREKIKSRSDWVVLHELLAKLYQDQEDYSKEIESLLEAVRTSKDPARVNRNRLQLGTVYMMEGFRDPAIKLFREVLEKDSENIGALNNLAYVMLDVEGAEAEALTMAERAYKLARMNPDVMDTYVVALLRKGDFEQAVSIIRQAIMVIQRQDREVIAEYYYHLAQGLIGTGQLDQAKRQIQNALSRLEAGQVAGGKNKLRQQIESLMSRLNN